MDFFAGLCVNLHACLCGGLQIASAQRFDFLDIDRKWSFPDQKRSSARKSFFS